MKRAGKAISVFVIYVAIFYAWFEKAYADGLWREDLSNKISIGAPTDGYKSVKLYCHDDSMSVLVVTEDGFEGVLYTRGSFYERNAHCFKEASRGVTEYNFDFRFDECSVKKKGLLYTTTIVVQNDPELIMPGDAAFKLVCDFRDREKTVEATVKVTDKKVKATISIADADPAGKDLPKHLQSAVSAHNRSVTMTLDDIRPKLQRRDEL